MWVEFVVGSHLCFKGFSLGSLVSLPPQKTTFLNSNLIWNQWMKSQSVDIPLQIPIYFSIIYLLNDRNISEDVHIKDLFQNDGNFIPFAQFSQKFNLKTPFTLYFSLIRAVTKGWGPVIFPGYYEHKPRLLS